MLKYLGRALVSYLVLVATPSGAGAEPPVPVSAAAPPRAVQGSPTQASTAQRPAAPKSMRGLRNAEPKSGDKEARERALTEAKALLESEDVTKVHDGLTRLARLNGEDVVIPIAERLRRGLPPHLADAAVDALAALDDARAVPALLELTLHRRWQLRIKAISALASLRAQSVQSALLYALNDPNAEVRAAAVAALGQVGDQRAVPALRAALDKGVEGAATAFGRLASPRDMEALLVQVSNGDVGAFAPAFEQMLTQERLPSHKKLKLIDTLVRFGSPSAATCLVHAQAGLAANADPRVAASLASAVATLPQTRPAVEGQTVIAIKGATP